MERVKILKIDFGRILHNCEMEIMGEIAVHAEKSSFYSNNLLMGDLF